MRKNKFKITKKILAKEENQVDSRLYEIISKNAQINMLKSEVNNLLQGVLQYQTKLNQLNQQLEEKDKEIEKLKQQYTILENENGKLITELIMDKYKKAQKEVSFGKQLAIQELEKVKVLAEKLLEDFCNSWQYNQRSLRGHRHIEYYDLIQGIDNQIEKLKGEHDE